MGNKLYKILNIFFVFIFSLILFNNLKTNLNMTTALFSFLFLTILIGAILLINKNIDFMTKHEKKFLIIFFAIVIFIQICCAYYLRVNPSWDFGAVFGNAVGFFKTGSLPNPNYLEQFPNNLFMTVILNTIFGIAGIFGVKSYGLLAIGVNIVLIDISIFLIYLTVKNLFNIKLSYIALVIALFMSPFFTYVTIYYTDTYTLVFPIAIMYLYSLFMKSNKSMNNKNIIIWASICFLTILGMKIKFTVLIAFIAIIIDLFLRYKKEWDKKIIAVILVSFISSYLLFQLTTQMIYKKYNLRKGIEVPYTHWVMMGMTGRGGWDEYEFKYTYSFPTKKEQTRANIIKIKERLNDYGPIGYLKFLNNKLDFTWSDGTYFAPQKLRRHPYDTNNIFFNFFSSTGSNYHLYKNIASSIHIVYILLIILSAIIAIKKKVADDVSIARLCIFGLTMFLLIWETRSRYLINFIPVLIITMLPIIDYILIKLTNKKSNYKLDIK